jgi:hypothetical protein
VLAWLSRILARDKRQTFNSPRALFRTLCKAHNLDRPQRTLLKQLAKHHKVSLPARLFLETQWFDLETLSPALRERQHEIESIRALLFASEHYSELCFGHGPSAAPQEEEPALSMPIGDSFTGLPVELPATYGPLRYEQRVRD